MLPIVIQNMLKYMPILAFQGIQARRDSARRSSLSLSPEKCPALMLPHSGMPVQTKNMTTVTGTVLKSAL
ncbi:hypothetical protein LXA43DRAFT_1089358 [Ganoderma leucocontextum]|nr:hypothetical protein LXA43DRAFT_1089358 [Ganoderma leucocontextum]